MATLKKIPLPGYTAAGPSATRKEWKGDYFGNANYQVGGDKLFATDVGMVGIETIGISGKSSSGLYTGTVVWPANGANVNESVAATYNNATIKWIDANNNEVANNSNISTDALRVTVVGV